MTAAPARIQIVILDDHNQLRDWIARDALDCPIDIVGQAASSAEMKRIAHDAAFDIAVLDVKIDGEKGYPGLRIALWLLAHRPEVRVLMYTIHETEEHVGLLIDADRRRTARGGVAGFGYRVKSRTTNAVASIERVFSGAPEIDERLAPVAFARAAEFARSNTCRKPHQPFTERELELGKYLAAGQSDKVIADLMKYSPRTVDGWLRAIYAKIGIPEGANKRVYAANFFGDMDRSARVVALSPMWPPPDQPGRPAGRTRRRV